MKPQSAVLFASLGGIAVSAAILAGFLVIGSPNDIRMRQIDETRVRDLGAIANQVSAYRRTHQSLPQSLNDLVPSSLGYILTRHDDPLGRPYEYAAKNEYSYELCAEFYGSAADSTVVFPNQTVFSKHVRGKQCFELEEGPPVHR